MMWEPTPDWFPQAACRGMHASLFFPERGDTSTVRNAQQVCAGCPVRVECSDYALDQGLHYGIFGGVSERGRRALRTPITGSTRYPFRHGTLGGYKRHYRESTKPCELCREANRRYQEAARDARRAS